MPLSRLGAAGAAGCGATAAPPASTGAGLPALWPGGVMPLSRLGAAGAADCGAVGTPPASAGAGLPALWPGGVMPLSRLGAAGAPLLVCAIPARGSAAEISAMTPTTSQNTRRHLLKRKTPHPRLEPPFPGPAMLRSGHETLYKLDNPKVNEIVPGGEHHQGEHQGQPDAKAVFLGALAKGLPRSASAA